MGDSSIPIPGTNENLETFKYADRHGTPVHREGVFIGDGDSKVKANVTPGGSLQVFTDPAQLDAFARLRVSNPETIFDSKQIHNDGTLFFDDQEVSGGSTTSTWSQDAASTVLGVGATTAGRRIRQTFRRFNYQPGKSQLVLCTFTMNASGGGAGITRSAGLYDDSNGIFIADDEGTTKIVRRSSTLGFGVDLEVDQADWSLDTLDGTGPSGVTLDMTKANILLVDFEWLGVGRIRCAVVIDGLPIYFHEFSHANNATGVYMSTPNLPVRYEIRNDGTGAASTIEAICSSVMSEGGSQEVGLSRYNSLGVSVIQANTAGTVYAVCGLRLKAANLDATIRLVEASMLCSTADSFEWLVIFNPTVAGTPTWTDETNSSVQFGVGDVAGTPSATTVTGGTTMIGGLVKASNTTGSLIANLDTAQRLGSAIDGTTDEMWLCVRPLGANADIQGCIAWKEIS